MLWLILASFHGVVTSITEDKVRGCLFRGIRLRRASELLQERNMSLEEIAHAVGYTHVKTFCKYYQEVYGQDVTTYKME